MEEDRSKGDGREEGGWRGKGGEREEGGSGRIKVGVWELEGRKLGGGREGGRGCRRE